MSACSKQDVKTLLQKHSGGVLGGAGDYSQVPGEDAAGFLSRSFKDQVVPVSDILAAMRLAAADKVKGLSLTDQAPATVAPSTATLLTTVQKTKANYTPDVFKKDDAANFQPQSLGLSDTNSHANDTVKWTSSKSEFTISTLPNMPVRNQGQRGTCASFAGIGHVEAFLIKKYKLSGIDLSQERFYYMSKPDNWASGGDPAKGGSNAGTGFAKSNGYPYQGQTYPPGSPSDYNLPLATDCPYNPNLTNTDLQTPQASGCLSGVAKVQDFAAWLSGAAREVASAQDIYNVLVNEDLPVAVASRLSANWEQNDGMITLAEADGKAGDTQHAAGHAYLVVGARQLDEAQFPGEGGMCFIIRNSWGKGWGSSGTSCMTLAWFNAWRFPDAFPRVYDVILDPNKFAAAKAVVEKKPTTIKDPDPNVTPADKTTPPDGKPQTGTVSFLADATTGASSAPLATAAMTLGALWTDNDEFRKILYKIDNSRLILRGLLSGDQDVTHDLVLELSGQDIKFYKNANEQVTVGSIDDSKHILRLCSREYSQVCQFNYIKDSQDLAVGLTKAEAEREESAPPYNWHEAAIAGYGIDFSVADALAGKVDIRLVINSVTTNPLRFSFAPSGDISYQGRTVGNVGSFNLCSGDAYRDLCRLVVAGDQFYVFFKAAK